MLTSVPVKKVLFLFLLIFPLFLQAQIDCEFWFAAPEVTSGHADRPILLHFSTFDRYADVVVSQPANPSFIPLKISLKDFSFGTIDLTPWIDIIENGEANAVVPSGLKISSTAEISAYYEVKGTGPYGTVNSEIYALKGQNALGNTFFLPFQNKYDNIAVTDWGPLYGAWAWFTVVATEDNTTLTITPSKALDGHPAGVPYQVTLNKGEVYTGQSLEKSAEGHPSGTKIESDKPVAVSISDDSVGSSTSYDLVGDQLIPVRLLGEEYVVGEGEVFVLPVEDNTEIIFGGGDTVVANQGQTVFYDAYQAMQVVADKPIYVFQVTYVGSGKTKELGGAILPPAPCTGSKAVAFTRDKREPYELRLLVRSGSECCFYFNGRFDIINGEDFEPVAGSNGEWLYATLDFPVGGDEQVFIDNVKSEFHLGLVLFDDGKRLGSRFGYFSNFASLELPPYVTGCEGDSLYLDAGYGKSFYEWSTGSSESSILVTESGDYSVKVALAGCDTLYAASEVKFYPKPAEFDLGEDFLLCENDSTLLETLDDTTLTYVWNTGDSTASLLVKEEGEYSVYVQNEAGCSQSDTVAITGVPLPRVELGNDTVLCAGQTMELLLPKGYSSYEWNSGNDSYSEVVSAKGTYQVVAVTTDGKKICGEAKDEISVDYAEVQPYNVFSPNGDQVNDAFVIDGIESRPWELSVYNRYGKLVYFAEDYANDWKADGLAAGTYFYELKGEGEGCTAFKGWVELVR